MTGTPSSTTGSALWVVMPAFDELPNLRVLIPQLRRLADYPGIRSIDVAVVVRVRADAREDEELTGMGATVVHRHPSDSFGDAMRSGLAAVPDDADLVITMDADGSHDPARIPALLERATNADVVVASRYVHGGTSDNALVLRVMSRVLNRAYSFVLAIDCRDVSTNFKLFHRVDLEGLELRCAAFDVVEELLFQVASRHGTGLRIVEVPDHFRERASGVSRRRLGPFIVAYLVTLARLRKQSRRSRR